MLTLLVKECDTLLEALLLIDIELLCEKLTVYVPLTLWDVEVDKETVPDKL